MKRRFNRRVLLRGGAAIGIALPWLEALGSRPAAAQTTGVKRVIIVFHGNGVSAEDWYPSTTGTNYDLKRSLMPLQAFKNRMIVTSGISDVSAKSQGGNAHTKVPHLLTGRPHIDGQFSNAGGGGFATGISFDQQLAADFQGLTPIPSLLTGFRADEGASGETPRVRLSYAGNNQPLTPEHRPSAVFDRIVGLTGTATGMPPDPVAAREAELARAQRKSVLDLVATDIQGLQPQLPAVDRARLEEYLTNLRDVELSLPTGMPTNSTSGVACPKAGAPANVSDVKADENAPQVTRQFFNLIRIAMQCDVTRVATFQWHGGQSGIQYSKITGEPLLAGVESKWHHEISHDGPIDSMAKIAAWHSQCVAELATQFDQVQDGAGSLLDSSVILYCNELSDGKTHSFDNIPFVLIGGGKTFQTGRAGKFSGSNNDLFLALFQAFGAPKASFGDPTYVNGPLAGLLA